MERIVAPVIELIRRKVVDSFSSRVVDQMADHALNSVQNIADFEPIFTNLKKNLKSLSAKAADVEEEITIRERSGQKKRKREVKEWLEEVESIKQVVLELGSQIESEGFVKRLTNGGKAAQLDKQVKELVEQSHNFGELVLDVCGTSGDTFLTDGMVGEAFNENFERIMKLLENRELSFIGVHGMGGVGKTTLAKHVNNRLLQQPEGRVLWVTVSQNFTIRSLQDKIARLSGVELSDEDEEDMRATRLHRALSREKNSVLILDDVWEKIDMTKVGCLFSADGCRLIVTTRSLEVCNRMRCQRVIRVEKLGEEEAWKLFNETLGDEIELGPQVEGVAKSVAKMCDGLPLGIITLAGSMRGEKAVHTWRNALAELKESVVGQDAMGDIKVFKVLKYSFDRLKRNDERDSSEPNMIQLCFLYCSLYPEDHEIGRAQLVRRFISDGLVDGRRSRRAQIEQGRSILDKLVNLCLLETGVRLSIKCVKMHDLVRGMALKICEGKYMARGGSLSLTEIPNEEEWTEGLQKVSFMQSGISRIEDGISPNCPNLSTLLLCDSSFHYISDSFFSKMQGLCILDLCKNHDIALLPSSIGELTSLKALLLENCRNLEKVPNLGKLKALRELNLSDTAIKEAPQGLEELFNLRFLSIDSRGLKMLPRGVLLKLGHLQHLDLPLHVQVETEEIESMKHLEEFGGGVKNVDDFNRLITTCGVHHPCYRIGVNSKCSPGFRFGIRGDLGWHNYNNLLVLCESKLGDEKVLGKGIAYLTISNCEGLSKWFVDDFSQRFDNPASLKRLTIDRCGGIEWIMRSDAQASQIFTLQQISLWGLDDLIGVVASTMQPTVFSFLGSLSIYECNKMRKMGLQVTRVPNLRNITIESCVEIQEIFEEEEDQRRDSATTLPKLIDLELKNLPRLKSVSKATIISNSIQTISITKCPRLANKLPLDFDDSTPPPTLGLIEVEREWWESLDWDTHINPNLPHLLLPYLDFV